MTTVTGLTAERMLAIEAASVVDGDVVGDDLFLVKKDGSLINAGSVRGPRGLDGPMGTPLSLLAAQPVSDIGLVNQIKAGRQLAPSDFTNMGLAIPIALWNLGSVVDSSGNGRNLTNKGAVPFGGGINGGAVSAAIFAGSSAQALYLPDTGAGDPFRIRTGSIGYWMRNAKRGVQFDVVSKYSATLAQCSFTFETTATNLMQIFVVNDAGSGQVVLAGVTDINDDRWHFIVATMDGTKVRLYVDGALDAIANAGPMNAGASAPFNVGGRAADASTATAAPFSGRVDETFVTSDVLSLEQIRYLMAASVPHALGTVPSVTRISLRKRKRGAAVATTDFPAQPVRLHNFTAGVMDDEGSGNVPLTNNSPTLIIPVAGAAGIRNGGLNFSGAHAGLSATDAGLPVGLAARSFSMWMKTTTAATNGVLFAYGMPIGSGDTRLHMASGTSIGTLFANNSGDTVSIAALNDGQWHHVVMVEDNAAADGVKRKLYIDGKVVAGSTVMNPVTSGGANRFRIGAGQDGTLPFTGQIDGVFVYAGGLTADQIHALYNVSSQMLSSKPKNVESYIEAVELSRVLVNLLSIESNDAIDLAVM